jgi:hypothetical protein
LIIKNHSRQLYDTSTSNQEEKEEMACLPYREAVGSIMYAAITARPDIAFIAGQLAQHCENPGLSHWKSAKRVLKYLAGTREHGLCFGDNDSTLTLTGYSDADYAGDPDSRRSTSGFVFTLNGGAVTWASRRQPIVALSTMESEYIAASDTCREAVWLRRIIGELDKPLETTTLLLCDNESAISLAQNQEAHKRSKHIDVRYHYISEQVAKKVIKVTYISTKDQLADILTKAVDFESQTKIMDWLGIRKIPEDGIGE